jgi:hypothetical protein
LNLRHELKRWQYSRLTHRRWVYHAVNTAWQCYQFFSRSERRSQYVTGWSHPSHYYQRSICTAANRYPLLFERCRDFLSSRPSPWILSFGCSTGEEVFSLGQYLPDATILGVDINPWCIRKCNTRKQSDRYTFCHRFSETFDQARDFDAVFCMAVFQRTENRTRPDNRESTGLRFRQFECEIAGLDGKLKQGGLLVIEHADYSFADTACFARYQALDFEHNAAPSERPLFGRNDIKVSDKQALHRVFVKLC